MQRFREAAPNGYIGTGAQVEAEMELLDIVVLIADLPEHNLAHGQIGTIMEILDSEHVLVEVADGHGVARAIVPVPLGLLAPHAPGR